MTTTGLAGSVSPEARVSTVHIPSVLRPNVGGAKSIEVEGESIRTVVTELIERHPSLGGQLLTDEGDLNRFVNVYVNGQDVRYLAGLDTPVAAKDEVPAAAGDGRRLTMAVPWRIDDPAHDHSTPTRTSRPTVAATPTSPTRSATRRSSRSCG